MIEDVDFIFVKVKSKPVKYISLFTKAIILIHGFSTCVAINTLHFCYHYFIIIIIIVIVGIVFIFV